jgi:hypothetical protein
MMNTCSKEFQHLVKKNRTQNCILLIINESFTVVFKKILLQLHFFGNP